MRRSTPLVWHEVECGGYAADLGLWDELAARAEGPVLDLGCGAGRVSLHLAKRGHRVTGLDLDAELVAAFNDRRGSLPAQAIPGDARSFSLADSFALVVAPMQLIHLFGDGAERAACLRCVAAHLRTGGCAAFALIEAMPEAEHTGPLLPDVREVEGWIYSSLPLDIDEKDDAIVIRRLRQTVSPSGELDDALNEIELQTLSAALLEQEAEEAGLRPRPRRYIPATEAHVGSTVVLLEKVL